MSQQSTRHFAVSDDQVIVHSGVVKMNYQKYATHFEGLNSTIFHAEYTTDLGELIAQAENTTSDSFVLKSQAKETADVREQSKRLEKSLRIIMFHIKGCFDGETSIVNEFRLNAISEYVAYPDKFIGYAKDVMGRVEKYRTRLIGYGVTEELITTINDQIKELDFQRREQIGAMQDRPAKTKERIDTMNKLWKQLVTLRDASVILFDEQPEVKILFSLPSKTVRTSEEQEPIAE